MSKLKHIAKIYIACWSKNRALFIFTNLFVFAITIFLIFFNLFVRAPGNFPEKTIFSIREGQTLNEVAEELHSGGFVKSAFWFRNIIIVLKGERELKSGEYFFEKSHSAFKIANILIGGKFGLSPIRITIPEGLNIFEIAETLEGQIPNFDKYKFVRIAESEEGYLFPDTYFLTPNIKPEKLVEIMRENFYQKTSSIQDRLDNFNKPLEEVINMASIIETEARDKEARRIISGILWRRIEIGMPLQVDVTFKYINGKNTYQLTSEDLKIDSPYNTYVYAGLPPGPIANPGLDAILAAIEPAETGYLYFLSDKAGNMYYAVSHSAHVENKRKYLNLQ